MAIWKISRGGGGGGQPPAPSALYDYANNWILLQSVHLAALPPCFITKRDTVAH